MNYKYIIHLTQFKAINIHFCLLPTIKYTIHDENLQIVNQNKQGRVTKQNKDENNTHELENKN